MSRLYLPVKASGTQAIAICYRCQRKVYHDDLEKDPNNGNYYCPDCVDEYDPYRLPPRQPDRIELNPSPRPDEELV